MSRRCYAVCVVAIIITVAVPVLAQTPKNWVPPKTPWGDPDLQGTWPGNMGVPMQRPQNFGDRARLTDEEFAQRVAQAKRQGKAPAAISGILRRQLGIGSSR